MEIDTAVADEFARLIEDVAPSIPATREPTRKTVAEPPLPAPTPKPSISEERAIRILGWAALAEFARSQLRLPVMMGRQDGSVIEFVDDMALDRTPRRSVKNNFRMRFSLTEEMESLLLPIFGLVAVTGPDRALDAFGLPLFQPTTFIRHSADEVTRLFRPTVSLGMESRSARWREYAVEYGKGALMLDTLDIRTPKNIETPFAQLPGQLQDRLLNPHLVNDDG